MPLFTQDRITAKGRTNARSETKTAAHSYKRGPFGLTAAEGEHYHMLKTPRGHFRGPCFSPSSSVPREVPRSDYGTGPSRSGQSSSSHWQENPREPSQKSGVKHALWVPILISGVNLASSHAPTQISSVFPRLHCCKLLQLVGFPQEVMRLVFGSPSIP